MNALVSGQAKYIVFDGIDGGGKSSIIEGLMKVYPLRPEYLSVEDVRRDGVVGKYFEYMREPGGTEVGEQLRKMMLNEKMPAEAEMHGMIMQRIMLRKMRVEPALFSGLHVISDRSDSATFAYQVRGRELSHLEDLFWSTRKTMTPHPSLYIFFDVPPETAAARLERSGKAMDNFESQPLSFFRRVSDGYHEFARRVESECRFVNVDRPLEKIGETIAECAAIVAEHIGLAKSSVDSNVVSLNVAKRA